MTRDGTALRIPLDALPDRARIHAVAVGDHGYSVPDAVEFTRDGDGVETVTSGAEVAARRPYDAPAWAEDSVIYEIYVRTFAGDSDESPFDAIIDRLDYLDSLGVDASGSRRCYRTTTRPTATTSPTSSKSRRTSAPARTTSGSSRRPTTAGSRCCSTWCVTTRRGPTPTSSPPSTTRPASTATGTSGAPRPSQRRTSNGSTSRTSTSTTCRSAGTCSMRSPVGRTGRRVPV